MSIVGKYLSRFEQTNAYFKPKHNISMKQYINWLMLKAEKLIIDKKENPTKALYSYKNTITIYIGYKINMELLYGNNRIHCRRVQKIMEFI